MLKHPVHVDSARMIASLRRAVKRVRAASGSLQTYRVVAAEMLIHECMRREPNSKVPHPFFERPDLDKSKVPWIYQTRVLKFAEFLYAMRNMKGFDSFCLRLVGQDPKASYFEAFAAYVFLDLGYDVELCRPVGKTGKDFDFLASKGDATINVEVTAPDRETYASNTVTNALKKKFGQVPPNMPSVVFLAPPGSWYKDGWQPTTDLIRADVKSLFRNSARVNVVIVVSDDFIDSGAGRGWHSFRFDPIFHPLARNPVPELEVLSDQYDVGVRPTAQEIQDAEVIAEGVTSPFFSWVDPFWSEK